MPEAAAEVTERNFVRHPFMTNFYGRIIGIKSMTLAEGQQWKDLRKTFNPGFSLTNIMTLMPEIVKQAEIMTTILSGIARNGDLRRVWTSWQEVPRSTLSSGSCLV